LKIFSPFSIFEQLVGYLPWKTKFSLKIFTVLTVYFLNSGFLSNLRLHWKTELPWNFSLFWNIFYHTGILSNLRLFWKQSLPWTFSLGWNIFRHSRILSNLRLPWKQNCP